MQPPTERVIPGHVYDSEEDTVYDEHGRRRGPVFRKGELLDLEESCILEIDEVKPKKLYLKRTTQFKDGIKWPPLQRGDQVRCKGFHFRVSAIFPTCLVLKPYVGPILGTWKELR